MSRKIYHTEEERKAAQKENLRRNRAKHFQNKPTPRSIAKAAGEKYYDGAPCKTCGGTKRKTVSANCAPCHVAYISYANYGKSHYQKHHEQIRAIQHRYWHNPKNKETISAANVTNAHRRRAREKHLEGSHTRKEWLALKNELGNICLRCRYHQNELAKALERDHVIPVKKDGSNWITNIQPLCKECNLRKGIECFDYRPAANPPALRPI
jgi:5-methylcytosine-specific restriction endonuclease McrA